MAGFKARGLKNNSNGDFPKIDFGAIAEQVDEGTHSARIVGLVDLGMHKEPIALSDKGFTGFLSEEDAEAWVAEVEEQFPKHKLVTGGSLVIDRADEVEYDLDKTKTLVLEGKEWVESKEEAEYIVSANRFGGVREYQEVCLIADLVDVYVDYGNEIGEKQFRIPLNGYWDGVMKGFPLKKSAPSTKGGVWTVKSNSKLFEIAKATGCASLIECELEDADWSELLGQGFNLTINKTGEDKQYINVGNCAPLKKRKGVLEEVAELDDDVFLITFDCDDVEVLKKAHLRGDCIKKIKMAEDFAGSALEKTLAEYMEYLKDSKGGTADDADDADDADADNEAEEKVERKVTRVSKDKKETKPKTKKEPVEDDSDDSDEEWND